MNIKALNTNAEAEKWQLALPAYTESLQSDNSTSQAIEVHLEKIKHTSSPPARDHPNGKGDVWKLAEQSQSSPPCYTHWTNQGIISLLSVMQVYKLWNEPPTNPCQVWKDFTVQMKEEKIWEAFPRSKACGIVLLLKQRQACQSCFSFC
jgi:hypothetical protein